MVDVVKQAEVLKNIIGLLTKEFSCKVYADEVKEDFKKPCFFIAATSLMTPQTVNWMKKELTVALTYYPKDSEKNEITYLDVVDRVQSLFQVGVKAGGRYLKIGTVEDDRVGEEDDVLQITITIPYLEQVTGEKDTTSETMEEVDMEIIHDGGKSQKEDFPGTITKDSV